MYAEIDGGWHRLLPTQGENAPGAARETRGNREPETAPIHADCERDGGEDEAAEMRMRIIPTERHYHVLSLSHTHTHDTHMPPPLS